MKQLFAPVLTAMLVVCSAAQSDVFAAELKVLSGNGPRAAVRELCSQFERATGNKIDLRFGVNPEVKQKIEAGETFDVVVGNPPIVDALIKDGIVAGPRADIGRASLGMAVRSGAPKPDISSVEAFKRALLSAKAIAFPGKGASGIYFVSLLDRMGIKAEMQSKLKPMEAEDTVEVVARGEADMVVVVATRIVDVPGVDLVGPIPEELQTKIGFAAGLSASTKEPEAAKALIRFLSAPEAAPTLRAKGVEPMAANEPAAPPAAATSDAAMAAYRLKLEEYTRARQKYEAEAAAYWVSIAEKRKTRRTKFSSNQKIELNEPQGW